jgi:hypothetical protein
MLFVVTRERRGERTPLSGFFFVLGHQIAQFRLLLVLHSGEIRYRIGGQLLLKINHHVVQRQLARPALPAFL